MVAIDKAPKPLLTQVQAALRRDEAADRIALVWPDPLSHTCYHGELEGHQVTLKYCVSELAMREALVEHRGVSRLVVVSRFDVVQLARDVLARLWRNEPQRISPWKTLEQLTSVQSIDPRLPRKYGKWMAEALLACYDRYAGRIQFGEVMDHDTAWRALVLGYLNYNLPSVDLDSVFEWSLAKGKIPGAEIPHEVSTHLADWFQPFIGELAPVLSRLILSDAADLLAIGLACAVLYSDVAAKAEWVPVAVVYTARGKFSERQLAGANVKNQLLLQLGQEAERYVLKRLADGGVGYGAVKGVLSKAEQLLASIDVLPMVECSNVLPAGFRFRLQRFALALDKSTAKAGASAAYQALKKLRTHALSVMPARQEQIERAQMALRLAQWLEFVSANGAAVASAEQGLLAYLEHSGFVDWARTKIWAGDADEVLSQVYQRLVDKVSARRESENYAMAQHLEVIARGDALSPRLVYVEQALETLLAPIAEKNPVLLLVLDGMSQAVFSELIEDLVRHSWVELRPESVSQARCLVSALPSITKVSRCSLLSGALREGLAVEEKSAFSGHPLLKRIASTKAAPVLFHKQELPQQSSGALSSSVRATIASTESRIVAAVINAIDDQLSGSSQMTNAWKLTSIDILSQMLEAAREAGRVVVITSDHGHVLDHDSSYLDAQSSGERYHLSLDNVRDQEVLVKGGRVVTEQRTAVLPWSEKVRYSKTRSLGYHGGASLQELVIPFGVFVSVGEEDVLPGWREVPVYKPQWWLLEEGAATEAPAKEVAPQRAPKVKQETVARMDDLFAAPPEITAKTDWIEKLFNSTVYKDMRARVGRLPITEEELAALLRLLDRSSGQLMHSVIVRELNKPEHRMRGFLSAAQRLLNVDGYPILQLIRESQTIKLDISALKVQFEL